MFSHIRLSPRTRTSHVVASAALAAISVLVRPVAAQQPAPSIKLAKIKFEDVPVSPIGFNKPIRLKADAATTRGRQLRVRAFRGTKRQLIDGGFPVGTCRLYGSKVRSVRDGTGDLFLGFAEDDWLNDGGDEHWVLVFEVDDGPIDGELLLDRNDVSAYFSSGVEVWISAAGFQKAAGLPAGGTPTGGTGHNQTVRTTNCGRLIAENDDLFVRPVACNE